jgi:hypothetical protein
MPFTSSTRVGTSVAQTHSVAAVTPFAPFGTNIRFTSSVSSGTSTSSSWRDNTSGNWISLKIGTTTIREKLHYLPHLPSDNVLGTDFLRRYSFSIDLERCSASLRAPAAVKAVQTTPAHPALQASDNSPPTLSIGKVQRLRQPLAEGAPGVPGTPRCDERWKRDQQLIPSRLDQSS